MPLFYILLGVQVRVKSLSLLGFRNILVMKVGALYGSSSVKGSVRSWAVRLHRVYVVLGGNL